MPKKKNYRTPENAPTAVNEPVVEYEAMTPKVSSHKEWNPNIPFHGTQEEWWAHFHQIEEGEFMTLEEFNRKFETRWKEYLTNKLK